MILHRFVPFHYGWIVVAACMLCIFACIGLGRFALGMLLPSMGTALSLSYGQMGWLSTTNFIGYLAAVYFCGHLVRRIGTRALIFWALLAISLSMIWISRVQTFQNMVALYTITGIGSGLANVPAMALVATWFARKKRGKAAGFVVIGSGFAILLAGNLIPHQNRMNPLEGWRESWFILGALVFVVSFLCLLFIRNAPEEIGLHPVGAREGQDSDKANNSSRLLQPANTVLHMGAVYFLFGFTYVIFATFIVTALVEEKGFTESAAGNFWSWVGFFSLFSGPVFGTISDHVGRKWGLAMVFLIQSGSYLLAAFSTAAAPLFMSIILYGIVAWSIPSIMAALVGDYVGPEKTAKVFGIITFIFGLGQISGPTIAGMLAEKTGSFSSAFIISSLLTIAAALLSLRLPEPATPRRR